MHKYYIDLSLPSYAPVDKVERWLFAQELPSIYGDFVANGVAEYECVLPTDVVAVYDMTPQDHVERAALEFFKAADRDYSKAINLLVKYRDEVILWNSSDHLVVVLRALGSFDHTIAEVIQWLEGCKENRHVDSQARS